MAKITYDRVRFIPWPSEQSYYTIMVGRATYGYIHGGFFKFYPSTSELDPDDFAVLQQATRDRMNLMQVTRRLK